MAHYLDDLISHATKANKQKKNRFKQFLKNKASEYVKTVLEVCEAYTSKAHPETGEIKQIGDAKRIRLLSGKWINRDIVGARNILLRALVNKPDCFTVAISIS
ncbi:MAG: hypothetical protein RL368_123 [Pseudomonadota bacterium]|jgi:putative transposase